MQSHTYVCMCVCLCFIILNTEIIYFAAMATGHHAVHRSAFWPGSDEYRFWHLSHKDSQVHVSHLGPTWVLSAPGRPHVGPMNLAIRTVIALCLSILVRSCRWRHGLLTNTIVRMTSYGIVKSVYQRTWY